MAMFLIGFACLLYTLNPKELAEVERSHPKKIEISYVRSHPIEFGRKLCIPDQCIFLKDDSQSDNTKFHGHKQVTYNSRIFFFINHVNCFRLVWWAPEIYIRR